LHFTPLRGWSNDPNGLVVLDGEHHLFHQHHPDDDRWGSMHWGHAVSTDLVRWEHLPIALRPDEHGWIYSGSAVIDAHDTAGFGAGSIVAVFTHASEAGQSQSLAFSSDRGRSFTPFDGNPVLEAPPDEPDFRDPKVFRWDGGESGHWVMVLAAGRRVLLYTSPDLRHWEPASEVSPTLPGGAEVIWETPDLFPLRVGGSGDARWVLSLAAMSAAPTGGSGTCYLVGDFDGRHFTPATCDPVWADHGPDFYAAQSWNGMPSEERVWVAWMGDWAYAQEVPSAGWRGVLSVPRRLGLRDTSDGLRLTQQPVDTIGSVLVPLVSFGPGTITGTRIGADRAAVLGGLHLECFDLRLEVEVGTDERSCLEIQLVTRGGEWTTIGYDTRESVLTLDRSHSGPAPFHRRHSPRSVARLEPDRGAVTLQVLGDSCSVEVFGNDGLVNMSALAFPSRPGFGLNLQASGDPVRYRSVELTGRPVHRVIGRRGRGAGASAGTVTGSGWIE
jgi:sucrose-6-phosphate hydrolase SacC (GH32 family)